MKLPDKDSFNFKEVEVAGDACWLITPKDMSVEWNDENSRFRSTIVRQSDNFVVSQGFGKFTNYGERPDFQSWDETWKFEARHKLDGSLLIVSRYKGEWILRTRGTVDARSLANGHEIDLLLEKYKEFFEDKYTQILVEKLGNSFLFEWVTPTNIIVLRESTEPKLILLGAIQHTPCAYVDQATVDKYNHGFKNKFDRPEIYKYNSIAECIADVKAWEGKEGVVIYSPDYQVMKKIKADAYLELHKLATGIKNVNQVLDVFLASPRFAKYSEFYAYVETTLDYEVAEKCKDFILQITTAYSKVLSKLEIVKDLVEKHREGFTRKEQAEVFTQHWQDWRKAAAFKLVDEKEFENSLWEKAIRSELNE